MFDWVPNSINFVLANKANNIAVYESKKKAVLLMKRKLELPFRNGNAFERALNYYKSQEPVSSQEEESLKIDIQKLFSEDISFRYSEINSILQEWNEIDSCLSELFYLIRDGEPDRYNEIMRALENEVNDDYSCSSALDKLHIEAIRYIPEPELCSLDYRELESKFYNAKLQYEAAADELFHEMIAEIANV